MLRLPLCSGTLRRYRCLLDCMSQLLRPRLRRMAPQGRTAGGGPCTRRRGCRRLQVCAAAVSCVALAMPCAAFLQPYRPSLTRPATLGQRHVATPHVSNQAGVCTDLSMSASVSSPSHAQASTVPSSSLPSLAELAEARPGVAQRFVFFGGKGGVGKTSVSSAMAVYMADQGLRTLVISTDPAHSLGDVLAQKVSGGEPVVVEGCDNLWAMEVDTTKALARFRETFRDLDVASLARTFGVGEELLEGLGLEDFVGILNNPPPGIDELIALLEVIKLSKGAGGRPKFDRVVVDTAPTGHTLRLLSFPDFLDGFLGKLMKLQFRLQSLLTSISGFFGGGDSSGSERVRLAEKALQKIEEARDQMVELRNLLRHKDATEFCVVTIATQLAVAESKRLLKALKEEGIAVRHLVVNKLVQDEDQTQHLARLVKGQEHCMARLDTGVISRRKLSTVKVPYLDTEVRGVYGLKYLGDTAYGQDPQSGPFTDLFSFGGSVATRFVLLGGKGGVGKTSSAAALAVKLAEEGHTTAVVSTDPAHSLGDALDMDLSSGKVTEVKGLFGPSVGELYALEVDTEEAIGEFKELLQGLGKGKGKKASKGGIVGTLQLDEFAEVLDSAPPGSDELVALARVLNLLKDGAPGSGKKFDRVIIDTAPTGHTLRLLSFPEFLDDFLTRVMAIRDRLKGASALLGMFSGGGRGGEEEEEEEVVQEKRDRIREFQLKMLELDDLIHDPARCEFIAVTIPTELAVVETERLVEALKDQDVAISKLIVNQVLSPTATQAYWDRLRKGQGLSVKDLESAISEAGSIRMTRVPVFDVEIRSPYALRVLADTLTMGTVPQ